MALSPLLAKGSLRASGCLWQLTQSWASGFQAQPCHSLALMVTFHHLELACETKPLCDAGQSMAQTSVT